MSTHGASAPIAIAAVVGAALWLATALLTGQREAWDAAAYWSIAYPLALMACAWLGYAFPKRAWRWVLALFTAQFLAMCGRNGELGNLWPLGLAFFVVLALPGILVARLASRFRQGPDPD